MSTEKKGEHFSIPVDHVSDTAYLVAAYRLTESKRPDRHFNDALAAKLLGQKAKEILERVSFWKLGEWTMSLRTALIDEILLELIEEGLDTVVNLAAGLDTRPYRLKLPKDLHWVEADLSGIIRHKNEKLKSETPQCRLTRVEVDLSNDAERTQFFSRFHEFGRFVVLTEGLLIYLEPENVNALSQQLFSFSNLKAWIMDIINLSAFKVIHENYPPEAQAAQVEKHVDFKFLPENEIQYFEDLGWKICGFHSFVEASDRLDRKIPEEFKDKFNPESLTGMGIAVLRHT